MGSDKPSGTVTDAIRLMSMTEIIRLQDLLSQELKVRFEKELAVGFSDIAGSTEYFTRFGDEAGRKLQQRHFDFLQRVLPGKEGRVVDTAGDGAFMVFPAVEAAAGAFIELQKAISVDNVMRPREHQLQVRLGLHWGPLLTDGEQVTGESVNLASRVTASAAPGEIRLTMDAFRRFSSTFYRLSSRVLGPVALKGMVRPIELLTLQWRDRNVFPDSVRIRETGWQVRLPAQDTISFGRLQENEGVAANDVVLAMTETADTLKISRWQFELRRYSDGFRLRPVSEQLTEVDGLPVAKGMEVLIKPGTVVRVARVATLEFFSQPLVAGPGGGETIMPTT
ncbi:MAG TPA: adenylate/guanylate cyclase domain-containing protein [Polyangia bacterium]|jgi:class 3 adenylate cyclase